MLMHLPPQEPNKNKTKNMNKKKIFKYSSSTSTHYINIIMLNSFQLKLVKLTKNKQNKIKTLQAHHVTTKTGQKKQQ